MKRALFVFAALAVLFTAGQALAQQKVYECVRPDGTVVCTVTDKSGDPSVSCNFECVDCNMVCAARLRFAEEGGRTVPVTPPPVPGQKTRQPSDAPETREYCQQRYQECVARCKSDPVNKTKYDKDACISSCNDWLSGCGMKQ